MNNEQCIIQTKFFDVKSGSFETNDKTYNLVVINNYFLVDEQLSSATMFFPAYMEDIKASFKNEDNNISIVSIGKDSLFFTLSIPRKESDILKDYFTNNTKWQVFNLDDVAVPEDAGVVETSNEISTEEEVKDVEVVEEPKKEDTETSSDTNV